jgi:hypothetical protein
VSFSDIIGYIITVLALFYFMGRGSKKSESEPEENSDDQAQKLKDFLRSLEDDMKEAPKPKPSVLPPVPKKKVASPVQKPFSSVEKREFKSTIENRKLETAVFKEYESYEDTYQVQKVSSHIGNAPAYEVSGKEGISRADRLLSQLQSKKQMVLLHEIFGKPKGL